VDELGLTGSAIKEEPLCKSRDRARGGKKKTDVRSILGSTIQDAAAAALSQVPTVPGVGGKWELEYEIKDGDLFYDNAPL